MALTRNTIDRIAQLTAQALIREMENAEKENTRPHYTTLANAIKLLQKIEVAPGDTPIVEPTPVASWEDRKAASLDKLRKSGKLDKILEWGKAHPIPRPYAETLSGRPDADDSDDADDDETETLRR